MPQRIRFTKAAIDAIGAPDDGRTIIYDTAVPFLALRITAANSRSWILYRRVGTKVRRLTLGTYPAMTIDNARRAAEQSNGKIAAGIDPTEEKRAARGEMIFGALWDIYLAKHARIHKRPRSIEEDERNYRRHLAVWAGRKIASIDAEDAQSLHARIGKESGLIVANRVLALLSKMYGFAAGGKGLRIKGLDNPARSVERFPEHGRERYVTPAEMPALLAALRDEPNETLRDFFLICLLTGARRRNVQAMRWDDVNLEWGTWSIASAEAKGGKALTLHIVPQAVELIRQRLANGDGSPWVFATRSRTGHLEEPKTAWARILARAKIDDLHIHDLRHTFGTWNAASGMQTPALMRAMGHRSVQTTLKYLHLDLEDVRQSLNASANAMLAMGAAKALPPAAISQPKSKRKSARSAA